MNNQTTKDLDERYIVDLVEKVVAVSVQTVRIVNELAEVDLL